ncbi:MAG: aminotransferase class V-fold PLP-dependent enzyme [Sneathiella sp.]
MSPLLKQVSDAGVSGVKRKSSPWEMTPADFFTESQEARRLFARLVNANEADIAIVPSASYGMATAAKNLPIDKSQHIIVLEDQFPSNIYCWQELAKSKGAALKTIPVPTDKDWTSAVLENIESTTAMAALPHCFWTDGSLLDLEAIGTRLREVGAKLALDVTQSLGAMPLDVQKIKPDFLVAACYKWLLGPYSVGFLYVAPDQQTGAPLEHNYINRKGSENFARLVDYQEEFQPGATRFDMGERANFALMPMAIAALQQILDWGVQDIYKTLAAKTAALAEAGQEIGLTCVESHLRAGHFLGLEFTNGVPDTLLSKLAEDRIYVSVRGNSLRVTPHLYNTDEDADRLMSALRKTTGK